MEQTTVVSGMDESGLDDGVTQSKIECEQCDKSFTCNNDLNLHVKSDHEKVKDFFCEICAKTFSTAQILNTHRKGVHSDVKKYPCHICGQSYKTKSYLIIHTRIHTGEKPHCCDKCGKSFADPSALINHNKMQHSEKQETIACEVCGKAFQSKKNIKRHMFSHSLGDNDIDVKRCKVYSNDFKLEALKKVTELGLRGTAKLLRLQETTLSNWVNVAKGQHTCQFCGKSFPWKSLLEGHIAKQHGDGEVGDGDVSRKGVSITHYNEKLKQEVVQFALATTRKEAKEKFQLSESTIRMWIRKSQGLDYRPASRLSPAPKMRFQGSLQDYLVDTDAEIDLEALPLPATSPAGPVKKPTHTDFLLEMMKQYRGSRVAQVLDKIKTFTEDELDKLIDDGNYKEFFDCEFGWSKEKKGEKSKKKTSKKTKLEQEDSSYEDVEWKPDMMELMKQEDEEKVYSDNEDERDEDNKHAFDEDDEDDDLDDKQDEYYDDVPEDHDSDQENENHTNAQSEPEYKQDEDQSKGEDGIDNVKDEPHIKFEPEEEIIDNIIETSKEETNTSQPRKRKRKCGEVQPPCVICGKLFPHASDMLRHMVSHTGAKEFDCSICKAKFPLLNALTRHMKIHEGVCPYLCSYCQAPFKVNRIKAIHEARIHEGVEPFQCSYCKEIFTNTDTLNIHRVRAHGADKPFTCTVCGHGFVRVQMLDRHMRVHTGEKPYSCEKCGESYPTIDGLKRHTLRHAINEGTLTEEQKQQLEEQKVPCEMCGQKFADKGALGRHIKSHSGIKDFICIDCGKAYSTKRSLELHNNIVHLGKKNYPCKHCGKDFGRITSLKVHELTHTGELPFKCQFCGSGFKEKRNLHNHVERSHPHAAFKDDESYSDTRQTPSTSSFQEF